MPKIGDVYSGGRKIGEVRSSNDFGSGCVMPLVIIAIPIVLIILIFALITSLITSVGNYFSYGEFTSGMPSKLQTATAVANDQANATATSYVLKTGILVQDSLNRVCSGGRCDYTDQQFGDASITVTATLVEGQNPDNPQNTAYGIVCRGGEFLLNENGTWSGGSKEYYDKTPNAAIKQGVGATNTIEMRMKGSHFDFFVNGTKVDEKDDSSAPSSGTLHFVAGAYGGKAVFKNLLIKTI